MASNGVGIASVKEEWGFVGGMCAAMQTLENVVAEIAPTNIPVLLVGESGTGKEMFARRIHHLSANADEPLMKIACASMNLPNFAGELGLNKAEISGEGFKTLTGTVFFDEISELDAPCQRSLLYALPDGEAKPRRGSLGARVISTTNRNLDDEMRAGRFRSELYYRINGVCLRLPPLRDRKEDIPLLVESFLTKYAAEFGRPRPSLSPRSYSLKAAARAASREAEREMILEALARTRWNRKRAAQELQISYKSLLYKLKQIGLPDSRTE